MDGATVNGASGGDAAANGFMISSSASSNVVIAFSLTGGTIPPGEGVLLVLDLSNTPTGLSNIIVSDSSGQPLSFTYEDGSGCMDESACNYDGNAEDEDGSCEYSEQNFDCEGNCVAEVDCNGECGGDAVEDECDVCNGDGASCALYTIDVLYNSDTGIAGFQFYVDNVTVISASGGAAAEAGFTISTGNNTVLAFSLTGAVIPAGSGVLVTLEVEGAGACISDLILSDSGANGMDATIEDCLSIIYVTPSPGCTDISACNYDENAGVDDGSCEYSETNYDCDGVCNGFIWLGEL